VGESASLFVAEEACLSARRLNVVADEVFITGRDRVQLKAGRSSISLSTDLLVIEAPGVDINCNPGLTAGTPDLPALRMPDAAEEAAPEAPSGADDAETGQKSAPNSGS
jgi:hypothetical protein